eukprot:355665-Chlamydomonas_euryale.AAC.2
MVDAKDDDESSCSGDFVRMPAEPTAEVAAVEVILTSALATRGTCIVLAYMSRMHTQAFQYGCLVIHGN